MKVNARRSATSDTLMSNEWLYQMKNTEINTYKTYRMLIWTLFGGIIATSSVCHVNMIIRSGPLGNWASLGHERSTHP